MTLADQDARRQAMTDFSSILLVEAAAGTGKTSLMAGRVAMMLAAGRHPGEIAAITFTELAASQLARRIRETVDKLLAGDVPAFIEAVLPQGLSEQQREALVVAFPRLDELTATTIHGFCQSVIRSHGVQAGLDPGARVVDATVAGNLFMAELSAWFSHRLAADAAEGDPIVVLAEEIPLQVVDLIRELANLRRKHPDAQPIRPSAGARPDIDFVQAVDDFDRWQTSAEPDKWLSDIAHELRGLAQRYHDCLASKESFRALWRLCDPGTGLLFERKGLQLKTYDEAARGFGAHRNDVGSNDGRELYETVVTAWSELVGHIASTLVCSLSTSLDQLLESYQARKRAAAVLDFDDLLIHVRSLVRDHDEVRQAIGQRYRYILVDEFQDTDGIQSEILFWIAATQARPGQWEKSELRSGALFLVGDPKQAIYRFRGADIEAYELCRQLIDGQDHGAVLEITANFRSLKPIIEHVNACFEPVFAKPSQPRYVALAPTLFEASHPLPCVARFTVEVATEGRIYAEMFRETEAERVADICAALIGNVSIKRADKTSTPLQAGDIALLSPGHTELWRYERALEQRGLAVSSQAGQTLMRRQETQDILALLRVLADSSDTLAFGALMRGPLVGLSEQELLDITSALVEQADGQRFFTVRTDPELVQHAVARDILLELQRLRRRASIVTPSLILAEAIERLNVRVIMAARHRNRNARALVNLDALIERARGYSIAGLRAFIRDLQEDWERKARAQEGRIDAAKDAVEIVTIHSAKGLEWPIVIPVNSTTELYRPDQFVHRQSDNTLHWMLGGVAPPELAAARAAESLEDANQRERIWYVACTRARDLLILPHIPQASKDSWFSSIDLRQRDIPELDLTSFARREMPAPASLTNEQSSDIFAAEQRCVEESAPPIVWRRPSEHDADRLGDPLEGVVTSESHIEHFEVAGAGARRGVILHKLMEELLTGELAGELGASVDRARELLNQLVTDVNDDEPQPDPYEMGAAALRGLALPQIAELRPHLVPEIAIWGRDQASLIAGRADALAIIEDRVDAAIDWKSDVHPAPAVREAHMRQLRDYLSATGAVRGAIVYLTSGEITWVVPP
ncbi:DNA helicase [Mesorhizobium sp. WSM4307]|uniref:UvrD-helicase domain-containing protein n=1 Tax=unclassified Mesorhizobium TaxID=325217 RepID=UPI000BAF1750|nr:MULTISPECIES: UvrD-helicase domain-containing protein [unclassified Mesorhizobium]PBB22713.1 DNA helicase [Mesorhizobium sp. WSM4304]PBB71254.1 DNA helicase [Mesorhizobium sp. WSM4308]TRC73022.1 DNA helicase [Mesorhizobium sp. WSM4315]TRC83309.1 DNA helicase [Mesorhizobium sp. WSM4307]